MDDTTSLLFHDVQYAVISPPQLPGEDPGFTEAIDALDANGATRVLPDETGRFALDELSHIIATTIDFPDYVKATERYIPVVRPTWIQRSIARGKQEQVRQFSPDPAHFMHDVILCCAGLPEGDKEAIAGGVIAMGGTFSESLTRLVTHLVTLTMDDNKVQAAVQKELKCKILLPHWFDDCLRLKRRIQEEPYILPDPSVLSEDTPAATGALDDLSTALTPTPSSMPPSSKRNDVFRGKTILLADDLNLSERTRVALGEIIFNGGGRFATSLKKADIFVCQYREHPDFSPAVRRGKDVGNLSWLYHLIIHNCWTNPMIRLLHYPIPRYGIPGMDAFKISVSNYTGFARIYLESLIKASGATFTRSMMQQNTHLITAHKSSEKCDAARDWGINIANHLWLEDCYAKHKVQPLTVSQYTHFPNGTNLGEVIGRTPVDRRIIEKFFLEPDQVEQVEQGEVEQVEQGEVERVQQEEQEDQEEEEEEEEERGEDQEEGEERDEDHEEDEPERLREIANNAQVTPARRDGNWKSTSARASKQKALSNIHNAAQDIALYNKELKRKGGVTHGRDRATPAKKQRIEPETRAPARSSKSDKIRVLVSMYERWRQKPDLEQPDKAKLRNLGVYVINDPTPSDFILCVPKILRTKKFACALAYGPSVISTDWLDACLTTKEVPDIDDYELDDPQGEEAMDFVLSEALDRAVKNKRKLLHRWQIFCTEHVVGKFDTFKDIVDTNGGTCCLFRAKTKMAVSKDKLNGRVPTGDARPEDELYLLSGMTPAERQLWPAFKDMAAKAEMVPRIVKIDWLLNIAISQEIRRDSEWDIA